MDLPPATHYGHPHQQPRPGVGPKPYYGHASQVEAAGNSRVVVENFVDEVMLNTRKLWLLFHMRDPGYNLDKVLYTLQNCDSFRNKGLVEMYWWEEVLYLNMVVETAKPYASHQYGPDSIMFSVPGMMNPPHVIPIRKVLPSSAEFLPAYIGPDRCVVRSLHPPVCISVRWPPEQKITWYRRKEKRPNKRAQRAQQQRAGEAMVPRVPPRPKTYRQVTSDGANHGFRASPPRSGVPRVEPNVEQFGLEQGVIGLLNLSRGRTAPALPQQQPPPPQQQREEEADSSVRSRADAKGAPPAKKLKLTDVSSHPGRLDQTYRATKKTTPMHPHTVQKQVVVKQEPFRHDWRGPSFNSRHPGGERNAPVSYGRVPFKMPPPLYPAIPEMPQYFASQPSPFSVGAPALEQPSEPFVAAYPPRGGSLPLRLDPVPDVPSPPVKSNAFVGSVAGSDLDGPLLRQTL